MIETEAIFATCQAAFDFVTQHNSYEIESDSDSSMLEDEENSNISMVGTTVVTSALVVNSLKDRHIRVNG